MLIDDIREHTSRTDEGVRIQTRRVGQVHRKDTCMCSCGKYINYYTSCITINLIILFLPLPLNFAALWTTVVGLAIAIVVVGAVPF